MILIRLSSVLAVLAVTGLLAAADPSPALAQANPQSAMQQMAGRWQCQGGIRDPQGRKLATGWSYVILLYPNGTFRVQGVIQGGAVRSQFQGQGRWQVSRKGQKWQIVTQGQRVVQHSTGYVQRGSFYGGGTIYSLNNYGHNTNMTDGQVTALSCRRAG
ncbi:MAG: hypothetical protein AAF942_06500 [Pseudomonadota bacterium]